MLSIEDRIKSQLGGMVLQILTLQMQNESLQALIPKKKPAKPQPKPE
jgi:hypothetical protein